MTSPYSKHARRRDSRVAARSLRAADPRVQQALSTAREQEARLEARIALQTAEAEERAATALIARTEGHDRLAANLVAGKVRARLRAEKAAEARREEWPLGAARSLIRQGYSLQGTIERTGWGAEWLSDAADILKDL